MMTGNEARGGKGKTRQWPLCSTALLVAAAMTLALTVSPAHAALREFYIVTVHYDGNTNLKGDATHKPEPFPDQPFEASGGMWVKGPKENGHWQARTFVFDPAQVTVQQGDEVRLHFVGVHGAAHHVQLEGVDQTAEVKRGTMKTIAFKAGEAGIITYTCADHPPSMRGQVVVLPAR